MNPILQAMNKPNNNIIGRINSISQMLQGKNPQTVYNQMIQSNPQFKSFVDANKGKSPAQIAKENGIDPSVLNLLR